jgi:hypothetical protein
MNMKRILSTSEIIATYSNGEKEFEVCATAEANYDEQGEAAIVELDCFIRPVDIEAKEQHLIESWLPTPQHFKESVSRSEASSLARDIFHRWVVKVRQSIPVPVHANP